MDAFDGARFNLNNIDLQAEALRGIERYLVVGFEAKAWGAVGNSPPDINQSCGRRGNINVLGCLDRGVGNARSTANENELAAEFRTDYAGGRHEAYEDRFAEWCSDGSPGRHVSEVRGEDGMGD